jgi:hypothetical protein
LVRCEAYPKKNIRVVNGVEAYIHGIKDGGADEIMPFLENPIDPRAIEDRKRMKLSIKKPSIGLLETGVLIEG